MSIFKDLVNHINSVKIGDLVRRKELMNEFGNYASIDVYRRTFTVCGFLEDYDLGVYKKINNIPNDLSSTQLQLLAKIINGYSNIRYKLSHCNQLEQIKYLKKLKWHD